MWYILFLLAPSGVFLLTCPDYKAMHRSVAMDELQMMNKDAIVECLFYLGREPLQQPEAKLIWNSLVETKGGVTEVTDLEIKELGWILTYIPEEDLYNFTLSDIDTIAALGQFRNLSEAQVLAERALEDWANKQPVDYTHYDLSALFHILCGLNKTSISDIHADAYKHAASSIASLLGCPEEALIALADLAQSSDAFGAASSWSTSQLKNVGCVINGLSPQILASIPASGFESLTPDLIPCIAPETLKSLDASQLSHLTPSAIAAMTSSQQAVLNKQQHKSVAAAYEGIDTEESVSPPANTGNIFILLSMLLIFLQ